MRQSVGDMVRSLAIVLLAIGAIMLVTWRPQPDAVRVVPIDQQLVLAMMQADFEVLVPVGLADDWRSTSVRWEPTEASGIAPVWHVGYVTPSDEYLQFTQIAAQVSPTDVESTSFIAEQTLSGSPSATVTVDGKEWQRWESSERSSLVRVTDSDVTVVSGTGEWSEIEQFAGALRIAQ
jgi:hypothetical protein